jgi:hypothetical protein
MSPHCGSPLGGGILGGSIDLHREPWRGARSFASGVQGREMMQGEPRGRKLRVTLDRVQILDGKEPFF